MKIILQKIKSLKCSSGSVGEGCVLFLCISNEDIAENIEWMTEKILKLKLYDNWKSTVKQKNFEIAIIPEFSVNINSNQICEKFALAKEEKLDLFYEKFYEILVSKYSTNNVKLIRREANEQIEIINDGPFTIILTK